MSLLLLKITHQIIHENYAWFYRVSIQAKWQCKKKVIYRESKQGIGSAYKEAFEISKGEFIIIMDADLSHNPKYLIDMINKQRQNDYDIVLGS